MQWAPRGAPGQLGGWASAYFFAYLCCAAALAGLMVRDAWGLACMCRPVLGSPALHFFAFQLALRLPRLDRLHRSVPHALSCGAGRARARRLPRSRTSCCPCWCTTPSAARPPPTCCATRGWSARQGRAPARPRRLAAPRRAVRAPWRRPRRPRSAAAAAPATAAAARPGCSTRASGGARTAAARARALRRPAARGARGAPRPAQSMAGRQTHVEPCNSFVAAVLWRAAHHLLVSLLCECAPVWCQLLPCCSQALACRCVTCRSGCLSRRPCLHTSRRKEGGARADRHRRQRPLSARPPPRLRMRRPRMRPQPRRLPRRPPAAAWRSQAARLASTRLLPRPRRPPGPGRSKCRGTARQAYAAGAFVQRSQLVRDGRAACSGAPVDAGARAAVPALPARSYG